MLLRISRNIALLIIQINLSAFFFNKLTFAQTLEGQNRLSKVKEACDIDPLDPKCEKYLDSRYRKLKDSEKEFKEDREERFDEQRFRSQKLSELRTFCRNNSASSRCEGLKKIR